jgi:hypothetical protein
LQHSSDEEEEEEEERVEEDRDRVGGPCTYISYNM